MYSAHKCVEDDDVNINVNVICRGAFVFGTKAAQDVLDTYRSTRRTTDNPAMKRRIEKLHDLDKR